MSEPNEESKVVPHDISSAIPQDIRQRLMEWRKLWTDSAKIHYAFGGLSVAASSVAAAVGGDIARYLAAAAAVLTALIGFVEPERRYLVSDRKPYLSIKSFTYQKVMCLF